VRQEESHDFFIIIIGPTICDGRHVCSLSRLDKARKTASKHDNNKLTKIGFDVR
jgi:hypothetical protein